MKVEVLIERRADRLKLLHPAEIQTERVLIIMVDISEQLFSVTLYAEGFNRFVTSTTAPIATGWSESYRAGFAPAG